MDVGVGVSLFDGKIHTRWTYYETSGERQSSTSPTEPRNANTRILDALQAAALITPAERTFRNAVGSHGLFDHETSGLEAQITANLTKNWRVQFNYAFVKAAESNRMTEWLAWDEQNVAWLQALDAANPDISVFDIMTSARSIRDDLEFMRTTNNGLYESTQDFGDHKYGNRRHKVSVFTRYDLPFEKVKGAYIGGGYRHQSKMFAGFDTSEQPQYTNSYWYADALAGYKFRKLFGVRMVSLQLNVTNVFDNRKPLVLRLSDDGQNVFRDVIPRPLTWKMTTNIDF
jgi:outer membrane receptor for ferric coprogen and ferric-rhodotorulic acid